MTALLHDSYKCRKRTNKKGSRSRTYIFRKWVEKENTPFPDTLRSTSHGLSVLDIVKHALRTIIVRVPSGPIRDGVYLRKVTSRGTNTTRNRFIKFGYWSKGIFQAIPVPLVQNRLGQPRWVWPACRTLIRGAIICLVKEQQAWERFPRKYFDQTRVPSNLGAKRFWRVENMPEYQCLSKKIEETFAIKCLFCRHACLTPMQPKRFFRSLRWPPTAGQRFFEDIHLRADLCGLVSAGRHLFYFKNLWWRAAPGPNQRQSWASCKQTAAFGARFKKVVWDWAWFPYALHSCVRWCQKLRWALDCLTCIWRIIWSL